MYLPQTARHSNEVFLFCFGKRIVEFYKLWRYLLCPQHSGLHSANGLNFFFVRRQSPFYIFCPPSLKKESMPSRFLLFERTAVRIVPLLDDGNRPLQLRPLR